MIKNALCFLLGNHWATEKIEFLTTPYLRKRCHMKCWCGATDCYWSVAMAPH